MGSVALDTLNEIKYQADYGIYRKVLGKDFVVLIQPRKRKGQIFYKLYFDGFPTQKKAEAYARNVLF